MLKFNIKLFVHSTPPPLKNWPLRICRHSPLVDRDRRTWWSVIITRVFVFVRSLASVRLFSAQLSVMAAGCCRRTMTPVVSRSSISSGQVCSSPARPVYLVSLSLTCTARPRWFAASTPPGPAVYRSAQVGDAVQTTPPCDKPSACD